MSDPRRGTTSSFLNATHPGIQGGHERREVRWTQRGVHRVAGTPRWFRRGRCVAMGDQRVLSPG
jgi:hypothetical protein